MDELYDKLLWMQDHLGLIITRFFIDELLLRAR
jgi:hypothetical protein